MNDDEWVRFWASDEGARVAGFDAKPLAVVDAAQRGPTTIDVVPTRVDAVVIGAGAGGGVAALRLAEAGLSVLVVERGSWLSFDSVGRDHLVNQRVAYGGHSAGPVAGNPRVVEAGERDANLSTVDPWDPRYHANAATIGGGTRVFGAQAWRFHPTDFEMATTYGVPVDSSLADWPIGYADLAPHYDRVEHELGVAADANEMTHLPMFERGYPMPSLPAVERTQLLREAAHRLGWATLAPPLAINTVSRDLRGACVRCEYCVGFACPTDAKNGTHNTYLPKAVATGNASILSGTVATRITTRRDAASIRATGVDIVRDGVAHHVSCDTLYLCAGAIESARLLMLSGFESPMLGRNLQGHVYVAAFGVMHGPIWDGIGPGPSIATNQWLHGNDGIVGGGMLLDDFVMLPVAFWLNHLGRPRPESDAEIKAWMRHHYTHSIDVKGPIQDIPSPHARVSLDPSVRDNWGVPVARLTGATHPESLRAAAFLRDKGIEWLQAVGANEVWGASPTGRVLSGGQHQAGTCRMGFDPATSVVDPNGTVHGTTNVVVADTSVHVTNGGVNPFLTAMALANRSTTAWIASR